MMVFHNNVKVGNSRDQGHYLVCFYTEKCKMIDLNIVKINIPNSLQKNILVLKLIFWHHHIPSFFLLLLTISFKKTETSSNFSKLLQTLLKLV